MRRRTLLATSLVALLGAPLLALSPTRAARPTRAALYSAMTGSWTGALEYKDYSNPKRRVTLPTKLAIALAPDSSALLMHYVYDDGPGKIVEDDDRFVANATVSTIAWGGLKTVAQQYTVRDAAGASPSGRIAIVLQGEGKDDNKPATIRETITISKDSLRILKETRFAGGDFAFRHEYRMAR